MTSLMPNSLRPDVTLSLALASKQHSVEVVVRPEERGLRLMELLQTCAAHASSGNLHRADASLQQVSQLVSATGDSTQRLASRFAAALSLRLVKRWPGLYKALHQSKPSDLELARVQAIFSRAFPYLGFAYAVIARTLAQIMAAEQVIHIVDFGSGDPKFWIPMIRSFGKKPGGPPHLRITCVHGNQVVLEKLGQRLMKEAQALNMPFQFNPLTVGLKELTPELLQIRSGESLAITSVLNLHVLLAEDDRIDMHFGSNKGGNNVKDCKQLDQFLAMLKSMSPKVFLLIEPEVNLNKSRLSDRFVEGLRYYRAVFESIEANSNKLSRKERLAVEEMFGREIENFVACEGLERSSRLEKNDKWTVRISRGGFRPVRLWLDAMEDAARIVTAYEHDGYNIICEKSSLMICWHETPLYAATAWVC